jgi:hypothetical protein
MDVSATSVRLLQAASEIVGGDKALAERLGIGVGILRRFLADDAPLPDPLLLRAVDIIIADRQSRGPLAGQAAVEPEEWIRES